MQHFKILTWGFLFINFIFLVACNDAARETNSPDISLNPPDVPQNVSVSTDNGVVTLSWSEVVAYNENTIPTYTIYLNQTANVTKSDTKIENIALPPYAVTGLIVGETYYFVVAAETRNGKSDISAEVSAVAPNAVLVSISLTPTNTSIVSGKTIQFKATGIHSDGSTLDVTSAVMWRSADINLVEIDNDINIGLARTKLIGETTITATYPVGDITGTTSLKSRFNHGSETYLVTCNGFGCHSVIDNSPSHPVTTNMCNACHINIEPLVWVPVVTVDHSEVIGSCLRCHDGVQFTGKPSNHINTTDMCDLCHDEDGTNGWTIPIVDHSQVIGDCFECHDGVIALGKDADHINTTNICGACHTNLNAFRPVANVDHNEVVGSSTCNACHDGVIAKGKGSRHFVYTALECDACHNTVRWPISSTYPHDIAGTEYPRPEHLFGNINCRGCHTQGTSTISAGLTSCARCHQDNYDPAKHINVTVSNLRDCSGACHKPGPEHRAGDSGWLVVVPLFIE